MALKVEARRQKELQQVDADEDENKEDDESVFLPRKLHNILKKIQNNR